VAAFARPYRTERNFVFYIGLATSLVGLIVMGKGAFGRRNTGSPRSGGAPPLNVGPQATLRAVTVAIDGRQRRAVQAALAQQSAAFDLSTATGMAHCAQAMVQLLWGAAGSVRYAGIQHGLVPVAAAQGQFDAMADTLRNRYLVETVRESMRTRGPVMQSRAEEGEGFVVVSLVVGFDGVCTPSAQGLSDWKVALQELAPPDVEQWVALRVVWSPTDEHDRMSSAELEVLYPELRRLDEGVGRMVCGHCRAVGAKELGRCPACGAPYPGVAEG